MKTTGLFTAHSYSIKLPKGQRTLRLVPFGDIHREAPMHASRKWQEFLSYAKSRDDAYFLGMGDYLDGCSTSERAAIARSGLHESTVASLADMYKGHTASLANELAFMEGRIIGLLGGNHYYEFESGTTSDNILAERLKTRFLGVCSLIRLNVEYCGWTTGFDIFCHHGKGGGRTPGATINTIEQMTAVADADFYFMGHDHKKAAVPSTPRMRLVHNSRTRCYEVREREPWLGRTGSFLKAYDSGRVSYNVDAGRAGCALGWIEFEITVNRHAGRVGYSVRGIS